VRPKLKPSTHQTYRHYLNAHIIPALGKHALTKLKPDHVQAFLNERHASGLAPRTVQQIHAILRSALNRALKWQKVSRNVATLVDVPRAPGASVYPLTNDGVIALLEAAQGHAYEHLYAFLLATGLRLGEALALRWQDEDGQVLVDLDARRVTVKYTLERLRAGQPWWIVEPKSESGCRSVPLTAPAVAALRSQRSRTAEQRLQVQLYGEWDDHGLVFPNSTGAPLDGTSVYHVFKRLLTRAGLPSTHRVHDLRHSTATYLLAAGVDSRIVMDIMGWSQASMLKRYQHVLPAMLDEAAARLEIALPLAR
jgi:integrase